MKELLTPSLSPDDNNRQRRYALGLWFIFLVCIMWTGSSVCAQYLYSELDFESPFLMTYIGVCLFAFILPVKYFTDNVGMTADPCSQTIWTDNDDEGTPYFNCGKTNDPNIDDLITVRAFEPILRHEGDNWNHGKHLFAALHIAPVMFIANWLFNAALTATSVASASVLVSTSSVFVFALALFTEEEKFHMAKFIGVLLSVVGTALTAWHDIVHHDPNSIDDDNTKVVECDLDCEYVLWGDILCILAAFAYGAYVVQVRLLCPQDEDRYSMALLLGYTGLVILVALFPVAILVYTQVDNLTWKVFGWIIFRGILEFLLSEYFHFRAVVLTNATVASVGLGLVIPMAFIADLIVGREHVLGVGSLLGALTVSVGFLLVDMAEQESHKDEQEREASMIAESYNEESLHAPEHQIT